MYDIIKRLAKKKIKSGKSSDYIKSPEITEPKVKLPVDPVKSAKRKLARFSSLKRKISK